MPTSTERQGQKSLTHELVLSDDAIGSSHGYAPVIRFYMSGDLRAATGISRTHLDFYLREGIVQPTARTESGYLLFDDTERHRLEAMIAWRRDGISLREIRRRLGRLRDSDMGRASGSDDSHVSDRIERG